MKIVRGYTDQGTFGKFYASDGEFICYTLERQWQNNEPFRSCIPEGRYLLTDYDSPKYGQRFALAGGSVSIYQGDENKRFGILIHAANFPSQLQGCIAPGNTLTTIDGQWAVASSRAALDRLENVIRQHIERGDDSLSITHFAT